MIVSLFFNLSSKINSSRLICLAVQLGSNKNITFLIFTVMPDVLTVRVLAEPVLKYNTAVLRCQVPQSAASYTTIVSWTRGDAHLYPSPRGGKLKILLKFHKYMRIS